MRVDSLRSQRSKPRIQARIGLTESRCFMEQLARFFPFRRRIKGAGGQVIWMDRLLRVLPIGVLGRAEVNAEGAVPTLEAARHRITRIVRKPWRERLKDVKSIKVAKGPRHKWKRHE